MAKGAYFDGGDCGWYWIPGVEDTVVDGRVYHVAMGAMGRPGLQFSPLLSPYGQPQFQQYSPYGQPQFQRPQPPIQQQFQPPAPPPIQRQSQQPQPPIQRQFQRPQPPVREHLAKNKTNLTTSPYFSSYDVISGTKGSYKTSNGEIHDSTSWPNIAKTDTGLLKLNCLDTKDRKKFFIRSYTFDIESLKVVLKVISEPNCCLSDWYFPAKNYFYPEQSQSQQLSSKFSEQKEPDLEADKIDDKCLALFLALIGGGNSLVLNNFSLIQRYCTIEFPFDEELKKLIADTRLKYFPGPV